MTSIAFSSASREIKQLRIHEPKGEPRAVLQIVHGMAEHYARYYHLAEYLSARGFAVAGYDQIGHGPETPRDKLGYLGEHNGWQRLVYDASTVHTILCQRYPKAKQMMLGQSAGSFVVREYLIQFGRDRLDAAILTGTGWQDKDRCRFGMRMAKMVCLLGGERKPSAFLDKLAFSANNKPFKPARTPYDWLSRDAAQIDRYIADPFCGFAFTGGGYRDLVGGVMLLTDMPRLKSVPKALPVLLMSGGEDPLGDRGRGVETIAEQYRQAGLQDVSVTLYPGARHELFNETNKEEVMADLARWLEQKAQ